MPGFQLLMEPCDLVYRYDGSLAGFYCCLHTCVYRHEMPVDVQSVDELQVSLLPPLCIDTDLAMAARVRSAVSRKISPRALELCEHVFLSCMERKEVAMIRFLALGFSVGSAVANRLAEPSVDFMVQAERHLLQEAHLLSGFIRFADHEGRLLAAIRPKNFVLPLLAPHFVDRYAMETFLIYDRTHRVALAYEKGRAELTEVEGEWATGFSQEEQFFQELWKRFYHTVGIPARENPRCRMTHMPKRYWEEMVEMRPLLHGEEKSASLHIL